MGTSQRFFKTSPEASGSAMGDGSKLTCWRCQLKLPTFDKLCLHQHKDHGFYFSCPFCWQFFPTQSGQQRHTHDEHREPGRFACRFCGLDFRYPKDYRCHLDVAHANIHQFKCDSKCCETSTFSAYSHAVHESFAHDSRGSRPKLLCHQCCEVFTDRATHFRHMYNHGDRLFCKFCTHAINPGVFKADSDRVMADHVRSDHTRDWWCAICSKSFGSADVLKRHWHSHGDQFMAVHCRECDMVMPSVDCLDLHNAQWHTDKKIPPPVKAKKIVWDHETGEIARVSGVVSSLPKASASSQMPSSSYSSPRTPIMPQQRPLMPQQQGLLPTPQFRGPRQLFRFDSAPLMHVPPPPRNFSNPPPLVRLNTSGRLNDANGSNGLANSYVSPPPVGLVYPRNGREASSNAAFVSTRFSPSRLKVEEPDSTVGEPHPHTPSSYRSNSSSHVEEEECNVPPKTVNGTVVAAAVSSTTSSSAPQNKRPLDLASMTSLPKRTAIVGSSAVASLLFPDRLSKPTAMRPIRPIVIASENRSSVRNNSSESDHNTEDYSAIPLASKTPARPVQVTVSDDEEDVASSDSEEETSRLPTNSSGQPSTSGLSLVATNSAAKNSAQQLARVNSSTASTTLSLVKYGCHLCNRLSTAAKWNVIKHMRHTHQLHRDDSKLYDPFITQTVVAPPNPSAASAESTDSDAESQQNSMTLCSSMPCKNRRREAKTLLAKLNQAIGELQAMADVVEKLT